MEKVYLIYAASFDSTPRVRFVSDTKGFTSNIKEAKVMTSDEAYFEYEKLSELYKLFVIETTHAAFSALRWDNEDNCPVNELKNINLVYNPEEYLKPKTYDWVIHFDNKFYYHIYTEYFEAPYAEYDYECFLPNEEQAKIFYNKTTIEAEAILAEIQLKFPKVKLELYEYVSDPFQ
jgi:hypothetical protein